MTLAGFVLLPFAFFGRTAFMAERVLGHIISSGIKVMTLAVITGIGTTLFNQFTHAGLGDTIDIDQAMTIALAVLINFACAGLAGILVPLTLRRFGADPAVSSSVFVTFVTDCVGFLAFLGLATMILLS